MTVTARNEPRRLTGLNEFLSLPETVPASELIDGEIVQKPLGTLPHGRAQSRLLALLIAHGATRHGSAVADQGFNGPGANHRVPDVAWFAPGSAPGLVAEVRSEDEPLAFVQGKLTFLRERGAVATLLVDPGRELIEVVDGEFVSVAAAGETVVLHSVGGFSFPVSRLFE